MPESPKTYTLLRGQSEPSLAIVKAFEPARGQLLKGDAATQVWLTTYNNAPLILKRWHLVSWLDRFKAFFKQSRGDRHWLGAARLHKSHIRTAACHALVKESDAHGVWYWLVMEQLQGPTLLEHLTNNVLTFAQEEELLEELAAITAQQVHAGFVNRDQKPSNLILLQGEGPLHLAVIDTVGLVGYTSAREVRMIASLVFEAPGLKSAHRRARSYRFLTKYLQKRDGAVHRAALHTLWQQIDRFCQEIGYRFWERVEKEKS